MQTPSRINKHHIGPVGFCTLQGIEGHRSRVSPHLLFYDRHPHTVAPYLNLFNRSRPKRVGRTQIHFLASLLKLVGQFSYRGGFAHTIHSHNQNDIGFAVGRQLPIFTSIGMVFGQERRYLLSQHTVEFRSRHIFVSCHALFNTFYDFQGCVDAHIGGYQHLFQVVQHIVVNFRLARYGPRNLLKYALLGFFQSLVECFLFLLAE